MLAFDMPDGRFQLRAAGVARDGDAVLLHTIGDDDFWSLPGGRLSFGETAEQALAREMMEELGATVRVGPLLWLVENFFRYRGRAFHEVLLVHAMTLVDHTPMPVGVGFAGFEPGVDLTFAWTDLRAFDGRIHPAFLRDRLLSPPASPEHIVLTEGSIA